MTSRMRIGQLAHATGVSTDTIRYYERIGLLPPAQRTESGYREYPSTAGNRILVIRNAVQLGFPLLEIAKVLRVRDSGGTPCRQVRDYAEELINQIDRRIEELTRQRASMVALLADWDRRLAHANGTHAHLLEGIDVTKSAARPRQALPRRRR
jgi:MerR family transcriptional regulator, copper efflux regulator